MRIALPGPTPVSTSAHPSSSSSSKTEMALEYRPASTRYTPDVICSGASDIYLDPLLLVGSILQRSVLPRILLFGAFSCLSSALSFREALVYSKPSEKTPIIGVLKVQWWATYPPPRTSLQPRNLFGYPPRLVP